MSNLLIWDCLNRIQVLQEFNKEIEKYVDGLRVNWDDFQRPSKVTKDQERTRVKINRMLPRVSRFLEESGNYPVITVREPPFVGGRVWHIDAGENIFNLNNFDLPIDTVTDSVDRAIGYYQDNILTSFIRTINPFWWLQRLLIAFIRIPFMIFAWAGYDAKNFENSSGGKLYKALAGLALFIGIVAGIFQILDSLKLVQPLQQLVSNVF